MGYLLQFEFIYSFWEFVSVISIMAVPVMMLMAAEEEAFVISNYINLMLGIILIIFVCLLISFEWLNTEELEAKPFLFFFYRLVPKEKNQCGRKVIRMKRFHEIKEQLI